MTIVIRTEVGIVEWAVRARDVIAVHRSVADALGRRIGDAAIGARFELLDRARRHGWCADEWTSVVPVLHDVDEGSARSFDAALDQALADFGREPDGTVALEAEAAVSDRLGDLYRGWRDDAAAIADAPYRHVLVRVMHELAPALEL